MKIITVNDGLLPAYIFENLFIWIQTRTRKTFIYEYKCNCIWIRIRVRICICNAVHIPSQLSEILVCRSDITDKPDARAYIYVCCVI